MYHLNYLSLYGRHTSGNSWRLGIDDVRWLTSITEQKEMFLPSAYNSFSISVGNSPNSDQLI